MAKNGLTGGEVLEKLYVFLCEKHKHKTVAFKDAAMAEIADDSDWHRSKTGYMRYEKADLFEFNDRKWALGLGKKCGAYPADPFDNDIIALEFETNGKSAGRICEDLAGKICISKYFRNSLIFSMADGRLMVATSDYPSYSRFGNLMREALKDKLKDYVAQTPEYDTTLITGDLRHPCTKSMIFKKEFVEVLAKTIEEILGNPPPKSWEGD